MIGNVNSSNVSAIQLFNAVNAFKNNKMASPIEETALREPFTTDGTNINDDNSILKNQNIEEIKKFAKMAQGTEEFDLTDEDIKYGLSYGRSVIVEYLA